MKALFAMILAAAIVLFGSVSFSQDKTPAVDQRQENQKARIIEGRKSGELTRKETRRLAVQQGKIKADEKKAKADGVVTPAERAKLQHEQNRASKNIYRQKHDAQKKK